MSSKRYAEEFKIEAVRQVTERGNSDDDVASRLDCNSWIVLRITNDVDREHVRSVLPDSMSDLTKMLSGLRRQEAIFVGQAATLPSRILIRSLTAGQMPGSTDVDFDEGWQKEALNLAQIGVVIEKWRYQHK